MPVPHPDAPAPGTDLPRHYAGCFACGDVPGGLRLRFRATAGLGVAGEFTVTPDHQGAPGLAHGGVIAAAFDEALGALQVHLGEPAVTGSLTTEFVRPVPVGAVLHLATRIEGRQGRKLRVRGEGRLGAADGPVAVRASALFVVVDASHFTRHGRPAEVAAVLANGTAPRPVNP